MVFVPKVNVEPCNVCFSSLSSGGLSNVVKTDYFSSFATTLIRRVKDFSVRDNYMFAVKPVSKRNHALDLKYPNVTVKGKTDTKDFLLNSQEKLL